MMNCTEILLDLEHILEYDPLELKRPQITSNDPVEGT